MGALKQEAAPRKKIVARPRPETDMKSIREDIAERYAKTLEYLGQ